jgi:hypothetical protein
MGWTKDNQIFATYKMAVGINKNDFKGIYQIGSV